MKLNVEIEDINAEIKNQTLVIWSKTPLRILSSALLNGGLIEANGIINVQVPEGSGNDKNDMHWSGPEDFLKKVVQGLQLPNDKVVGLMTAAQMQNVVVGIEKYDETTLTVFVTAGSTVAVTAGEPAVSKGCQLERTGTINIILLVDGNLTEGCMVDALKTATEAKTVALRELDIRSRFSGDIASGTLTDSMAIGCTKNGGPIQFAGTFTMLGELIAKCVRAAVKTAIYKQEKLMPNRPLAERLAERGISPEIIMSLMSERKIINESSNDHQLQKHLELILSDRKIVSLVIAALRLDDDLFKGLIPAKTANTVDQVSFEEIIQTALRCSMNELSQLDSIKEKPFDETHLGPFTKCLLIAILKKAQSNSII
jgi:adenosylcobinamide hydrolase